MTHQAAGMARVIVTLALILAILPLASSYCNLKTYHVCINRPWLFPARMCVFGCFSPVIEERPS